LSDAAIRIFVVEDEPIIQELLRVTLEDGGFGVDTASDGNQAIDLLEVGDPPCRALITDIRLAPSALTGWDVARRARELHPDLPVVYITGDSGHHWSSQGVPNSVLVMKPFAVAQVVTAVSQLLNAARPHED